MTNQLNMFESSTLRDEGIKQALQSAEDKAENWGEQAYSFLLEYIKTHTEFMAEEVRVASSGIVPEPPSKRAWGGVIVRARKNNLIESKGFSLVSNPKAHRTPATLWILKNINQ